MDNDPYELHQGLHVHRFEPPDLVITKRIGNVSLEQMLETAAAYERFFENKRWLFVIVDLRRVGMQSASTRTVLLERMVPMFRAVAIMVANPQHRLAYSRLLTDRVTHRFVDDDEEARAWIEKQRAASEPSGSSPGQRRHDR